MLALADRISTHARAQQAAELSLRRHRAAQAALAGAGRPAALLLQADRDRDQARLGLEAAVVELRETAFGVDAARDDLVEASQALEASASSRSGAATSTRGPAAPPRSARSPT